MRFDLVGSNVLSNILNFAVTLERRVLVFLVIDNYIFKLSKYIALIRCLASIFVRRKLQMFEL